MKSTVRLSKYNIILTLAVTVILIIGLILSWNTDIFLIVSVLFSLIIVLSLWYAPISISVNEETLSVHAPLKIRRYKLADIESVELFQPTMGALRIFGSGGFWGYWGLFKEGDIGHYIGFYGKSSDCFLVRMKNGDKYVLGCEEAEKVVDYIYKLSAMPRNA